MKLDESEAYTQWGCFPSQRDDRNEPVVERSDTTGADSLSTALHPGGMPEDFDSRSIRREGDAPAEPRARVDILCPSGSAGVSPSLSARPRDAPLPSLRDGEFE